MSLTAKDVEEIMKLLESSSFDALALEVDGMKIELERGGAPVRPRPRPRRRRRPPRLPCLSCRRAVRDVAAEGLVAITARCSASSTARPSRASRRSSMWAREVDTETVIGIVEVMKLMNSVAAGVTGEIVEIVAANCASMAKC